MKQKKIIFLALSFLFLIVLLNYGPMLYRRLTGNGGTWVEFYNYNTSSDLLLSEIMGFKQRNKELWPPNDTNLCFNRNDCVYIPFYCDQQYYHIWINKTSTNSNLLLVFGGVSTSPKYEDAQLVNRDMSFLTRQKTLNKFEDMVLDNLKIKPVGK